MKKLILSLIALLTCSCFIVIYSSNKTRKKDVFSSDSGKPKFQQTMAVKKNHFETEPESYEMKSTAEN